jgi:sialidase-1
MFFEQTDLFVSGQEGYHTYRIPALAVTQKGTILAFCEGRKHSRSDAGKIDLMLKRSFDGGNSWGPMQLLVAQEAMTCGNPAPVVDEPSGTIWLPFCKNLAEGHEGLITEGKAPRTVWITGSVDDGQTWAEPKEITHQVKGPTWTWYATGPCHGIQLHNGRLLIPCDHRVGKHFDRQDPYHSHVIFSDDHGASWRIGGIVEVGTNECAAVQTTTGDIYINCRNYLGEKRRAYAWSQDNGETFSARQWDDTLVEPICQASVIRFTDEVQHDKNRILFSNPASTEREKLTVRLSYDECQTWPVSKLLHEGPSAYSDLAIAPDMTICCLYERGTEHCYEKITFARFDVEWLTEKADHIEPKFTAA